MNLSYISLITVAALIVIGLFHVSLRRILTEIFAPLRDVGRDTGTALADARDRLQSSYLRFRRNEGMAEPNRFGSYLIGAALFSALFVLFAVTDWNLIAMTLNSMLGSEQMPVLYGDADVLSAITLIGAGFFWGLVLWDLLHKTHLAPWDRLTRLARGILLALALLCFFATLAMGVVLGLYRTHTLLDNTLPPDSEFMSMDITSTPLPPELDPNTLALDDSALLNTPAWQIDLTRITMVTLPILALISAGTAGFGSYMLLMFAFLGLNKLLQTGLWLLEMLATLVIRMILVVWGPLDALLEFLARIGVFLAAPLGLIPAVARLTDVRRPVGSQAEITEPPPPGNPPEASPRAQTPSTDDDDPVIDLSDEAPRQPSRNWAPFGRRPSQ